MRARHPPLHLPRRSLPLTSRRNLYPRCRWCSPRWPAGGPPGQPLGHPLRAVVVRGAAAAAARAAGHPTGARRGGDALVGVPRRSGAAVSADSSVPSPASASAAGRAPTLLGPDPPAARTARWPYPTGSEGLL